MKTKKMKQIIMLFNSESGAILPIVIILTLALTITGLAFLNAGVLENSLVRKEIAKNQAFYLAEAGVERLSVKLYAGEHRSIKELEEISGGVEGDYRPAITPTTLGEGQYWVEYYEGDPDADPPILPWAISIGQTLKDVEVTAEKKIKVKLPFLAEPYEHAIYAASSYSPDWTLELRGTDPLHRSGRYEYGGKDWVEGDIYANADVNLYEETRIDPPPAPNTYELLGEVNSTQEIIKHPDPGFAGHAPYINEYVEPIDPPDLRDMNYAENHTHDVAQIFEDEGISSGNLPYGHELYDVVKKNDSERSAHCATTPGDDYFFRPAYIGEVGDSYTAPTPLDLGEDRVYYVDGDVWFDSSPTYGFTVSGKATIVATGHIHIGDNIVYGDSTEGGDLLALVALGTYDADDNLTYGGNVYFGDALFGTTYTVSAFMFAGNNFLYNVNSTDPDDYQRPDTGFNIFGNWVAVNEVSVIRDWYETGHWESQWVWWPWPGHWEEVWVSDGWSPAYFDLEAGENGEWKDVGDDHILTEEELGNLRHYQMKVTYDERIRDPETQPPGLPQGYGSGSIFAGFTEWEEI
jgi:hypothetical protein